jgi:isocitrate dehydrogenase
LKNELKVARIIRDRWNITDRISDDMLVQILADSLEYQWLLVDLYWQDLLRAIKDALPNWLKWLIQVQEVKDETN